MEQDFLKHRTLLAIFKNAAINFLTDGCFTLSSSISFYFLLSIIPFVALIIILFNIVARIISTYHLQGVTITALITEHLVDLIPFITPEWIEKYVINPASMKSFTIMGMILLPFISSLIFNILETAYRRIFKLAPRHILISKAIYPVAIITVIMLIFVVVFIANVAAAAAMHLIHLSPRLERLYDIVQNLPLPIGIYLISPVVFLLFFFITTKIFLNLNIRFKYQLFSGLLFYVLWLCAKKIFWLYVTRISSLTLIYGSLSSIIIMLIWIYYSAMALLFSVEVMHELHLRNAELEAVPAGKTENPDSSMSGQN
ncbi:MAG: YihY/virulence factor BrkB family protein [Thermodesulfobacteriota bacterium]|nr:YihY/virulence factor BrkB family protein [Thermodesulfobacteriota bacterium]